MRDLIRFQLPEGDGGYLVLGLRPTTLDDCDASVHIVAVTGQGGQHGKSVPLRLGLAQNYTLQGHHSICSDDQLVFAGLTGYCLSLAQAQLLHQLGGGGIALHMLIHVGRDHLKLQPDLPHQLLTPGRLGR